MMTPLMQQIAEAALEAGRIMKSADQEHLSTINKEGHANFVTKYDMQVQRFLMEKLAAILPEAHFVGEENGQEVFLPEYKNGFTFVIDPIDGTTNFMKAYRPSVTSIGLLKDGEPYLGVIYNPYTDQLYRAEKGLGAFENDRRITTSPVPLSDSLVSMGTAPYYGPEISRSAFEIGYWYLDKSIDIRRSGSAANDICMVASGRTGLFFEPQLGLWDYAAGAVILAEAGGQFCDMHGKPIPFTGKTSFLGVSGAIAGNGGYMPPEELMHGF
ncbi:MAG: inositol monophosphatase [Blautia sp.]|nr:inositol monophosphatase [Blautia sp.]